jgi:hypothetical protein
MFTGRSSLKTLTLTLLVLGVSFNAWIPPIACHVVQAAPATKAPISKSKPVAIQALEVSTAALVSNPKQYLGKRVTFQATFSGFSGLGLDYAFTTKDGKKQKKSSKEYVTLTVLRGDVTHHQIPLSELKIFANRSLSTQIEKVSQGDILRIEGEMLSDTLGDAWLEAKHIKIVKAAPKKAHS